MPIYLWHFNDKLQYLYLLYLYTFGQYIEYYITDCTSKLAVYYIGFHLDTHKYP